MFNVVMPRTIIGSAGAMHGQAHRPTTIAPVNPKKNFFSVVAIMLVD
jgi:hypothetical protein